MAPLRAYLVGLRAIHSTGEAVEETSYYGQLETLLNDVGRTLSPAVRCVLTTRNRGAGVPDGGLFIARRAVQQAGEGALLARAPERGVLEVKGPGQDALRVCRTSQVRRYLERYGKVLVCTYRDFIILGLDAAGQAQLGERFTLAVDERSFWALDPKAADAARGEEFAQYLRRALLADAPLSAPADLAWFLAAYARTGLGRVQGAGDMPGLAILRSALEEALGLRFEGEEGEHFFRSALVQTLFYGVFAAWVIWAEQQAADSTERFTWRQAQWTLSVPMVRVLFQQLATPTNLPVGLDEVLDWTDDVLARVDRSLFFRRFESAAAVQYFYEPFLQAYDPELRRQLGVWYTPPEAVYYMVERIDQALRELLGLPRGLADERVHVLDPCAGTGSYLTAVIDRIIRTLREDGANGLAPADTKQAALTRIHGFELLPAPFVIAHLQVGLALAHLGVPLDAGAGERARVYLTNALTGWAPHDEPPLPFPEFAAERDAAESVKREQPILVVLGNPPYNGFAGVSGREEGGLLEPYKEGLAAEWDITKNKLDDLYIRFYRVAERRIAQQTGRGIVCFISNSSWLGDPSAVVMRRRLLAEFDHITIDNLNGDSRETGKKTPAGEPDPSVFSTELNPAGITRGVAISLLVRSSRLGRQQSIVRYRDFWGQKKRQQLLQAADGPQAGGPYEPLSPNKDNWFRMLRFTPRVSYFEWPAVTELCAEDPMLGLNENRQFALIDDDRGALMARMQRYLDPGLPLAQVDRRLAHAFAGFDPEKVRARVLRRYPFAETKVKRFQFRPLDMRYAYVETDAPLWNRGRPLLVAAAEAAAGFLLVRRRAPRALDGAACHFSDCLVDQKVLFTDAYAIPLWLGGGNSEARDTLIPLLVGDDRVQLDGWRPNLSERALAYLKALGVTDVTTSKESASLIWLHALAVGFSPLYVAQNCEAVRADWPRVPLPRSESLLRESAGLGAQIAHLLNLDRAARGVDSAPIVVEMRNVAAIERVGGGSVNPAAGELALSAGWGIVQARAVMPGAGKLGQRQRMSADCVGLSDAQREALGEQILDVYLNDRVCWRDVPAAAWDFKIGGFQVLRKWLSYRDRRVLGRDLTIPEARTFTAIARRLTALALLAPALDANYIAMAESPREKDLQLAGQAEAPT